jgi:ABC-type glutathione transport system ATPase component
VRGLVKRFGAVEVVKGVSFDVAHGETLAIVGESGSGKSTIAKMVAGYLDISGGEILFSGTKMGTGTRAERLAYRDKVQMVFQDPASSLNPRQTLEQIIGLPLHLRGMTNAAERRDTVADLLDQVHLPRSFIHRRPTSLSGGQKQRASIARALALKPSILVLDEPTSALDVSVQARIVDLLKELREKLNLTYIFISHDLGVVRNIADRVAVMYHGDIVETGPAESLFSNPQTDYARTLIAAVPRATAN